MKTKISHLNHHFQIHLIGFLRITFFRPSYHLRILVDFIVQIINFEIFLFHLGFHNFHLSYLQIEIIKFDFRLHFNYKNFHLPVKLQIFLPKLDLSLIIDPGNLKWNFLYLIHLGCT